MPPIPAWPTFGVNAIATAATLIGELQRIEDELNAGRRMYSSFGLLEEDQRPNEDPGQQTHHDAGVSKPAI